eukprot:scpid36553/ scgid21640/ Filamin-A; Actin-binding protein 280; Alpha-filamin; Endothelial actin-binding protein; Filamin-1; Non-muscle filamin
MNTRRASAPIGPPKRTSSFCGGIGVSVRQLTAKANAIDAAVAAEARHFQTKRHSNGSARPSTSFGTQQRAKPRLQRSMSVSGAGIREDHTAQEEDILGNQAHDPEAEWKKIQVKTFTRWCNQHMKGSDLEVNDLETDFEDGLALIKLVESLSKKSVGKYNKVPKRIPQKLENVGCVLNFLQFEEGLKLVNIGNTDIVTDHNLKLILGLIWHLILHYQVSMLTLDGDDGKKKFSPKDMLLRWLRQKLAPREVANLTTAWNNGKLIAALVNVMGPGLFPNCDKVNPENNLKTAEKAMKLAEDWLGVPQVLGPSDLCNPRVDEKSMITYLSFFPAAKLKDGAPVEGGGEVNCYGPALEGDVVAHEPSSFTIDASKMRFDEEIGYNFSGPARPEVSAKQRGNDRIVDVAFQSDKPGTYNVNVTYGGEPVSDEPLTIHVVRPPPDASRVQCRGPGLHNYDPNVESSFKVDASMAGGTGFLQVGIEGNDRPAAAVIVEHLGDYVFEVRYICSEQTTVLVHILWHGVAVPGSPYTVHSQPK